MNYFSYKLQIKESCIDMLGHVNNAAYLKLFEEARWDFITRNGYGLKEVLKTQESPVVLEINLKFKKELHNRENIEIRSYFKNWESRIGKIYQEVINEKGEISCTGDFTIGFFDMKKRKLIHVSESFLRAIKPSEDNQ